MNSAWIRSGISALLLTAAAGVALAATRGPDASGYTATDSTAFTFVDISGSGGGTSVLSGTDDGTAALTLPFSFRFYGQNYTALCASSNGAVYFTDTATCAAFGNGTMSDFANIDLTSAPTPGDLPAILPFWTDLSFADAGAGALYYQTIGSAPNRRFILQWQQALPSGGALPVTFQVILSEGSNNIAFQYSQVSIGGGDPANNGGLATIGIRKTGGGANQVQWSYNSAVLSNAYALLFSSSSTSGGGNPPSSGGGGGGGGAPGGTPPSISWAAPASITYGTPLGPQQLNATANVAGTYTYVPPAGTILAAGQQTLSVSFSSGAVTLAASVTITVDKAPQTITFAPLSSHLTTDAPFALSATATSGLPVSCRIVSGPATLNAGLVSVTGAGSVVVECSQSGGANYLAAPVVTRSFTVTATGAMILSLLNAASYTGGALASGEYAVIFGASLATGSESATALPLPTTLGGISLSFLDSAGRTNPALLSYVSPTQINFVTPDGLASGPATLTILTSAGQTTTLPATVATIAPALFTADSTGKGTPAALVLTFSETDAVDVTLASACTGTPLACTPVPIDLSRPGSRVFVSLYGTGIRGRADLSGVTASIGGLPAKVTFAGAQPTLPGLDQINVALDPSLSGQGQATLQVTVDGVALNPVTINIR